MGGVWGAGGGGGGGGRPARMITKEIGGAMPNMALMDSCGTNSGYEPRSGSSRLRASIRETQEVTRPYGMLLG